MYQCGVINCSKPMHCVLSEFRVYVGPRVGAHICLNLGVGLDRILHHTAKYLRVVARLPLAIYISAWGRSSLAILLAAMHQLMLLRPTHPRLLLTSYLI